jgi:hypothetical protein
MRLRVDRMCKVWQRGDITWSWRCCVCTSEVLVFTGTATSWESAYADADRHIRSHAMVAGGLPATSQPELVPTYGQRDRQPALRAVTRWPQIGTAADPSERSYAAIPSTASDRIVA